MNRIFNTLGVMFLALLLACGGSTEPTPQTATPTLRVNEMQPWTGDSMVGDSLQLHFDVGLDTTMWHGTIVVMFYPCDGKHVYEGAPNTGRDGDCQFFAPHFPHSIPLPNQAEEDSINRYRAGYVSLIEGDTLPRTITTGGTDIVWVFGHQTDSLQYMDYSVLIFDDTGKLLQGSVDRVWVSVRDTAFTAQP